MWKNDKLDDVQKGLLDQNIIAIGGDIDGDTALYIREALLRLIAKGSPAIKIFITSAGGSVDLGLDIYDALRNYSGETTGVVQGYARSIAVVILQGCKKKVAMCHSRFLVHHISMIKEISLDILRDSEKVAQIRDDLEKSQAMIYEILSNTTKQPLDKIKDECAKNREMTAMEAKKFGLIDEIE